MWQYIKNCPRSFTTPHLSTQTLSEGESKYWSLTTEVDTHVQQLVKAIQTPWESMFETTLPINYK